LELVFLWWGDVQLGMVFFSLDKRKQNISIT
jgi:hypothetical protein